MAENHLDGRVIGFALDGTGYGSDGNIWGGEVLVAGYKGFERVAHLDYISMPGGAAAIVEPRRMAVSYLFRHFGRHFWDLNIPFVRALDRRRTEDLLRLIERGINCPLTSSTGRLFDAVAAMAGVRGEINYEAQGAIELEAAIEFSIDDGRLSIAASGPASDVSEQASMPSGEVPALLLEDSGYRFAIREDGETWSIDSRLMFLELAQDLREGVPTGVVSYRFHAGFVAVLARVAGLVRERTGLDRICLSGGSFQNCFLSERLQKRLEADGFQVFTHAEVPCGDGGISLGQAVIAAHRFRP
jgi:hydrogenase maturation protein HypF